MRHLLLQLANLPSTGHQSLLLRQSYLLTALLQDHEKLRPSHLDNQRKVQQPPPTASINMS